MNISILAAIRAKKPRKDNTCAILIRISYNRKVILTQGIGKYIELVHWDQVRRVVKRSHPNSHVINSALHNRVNELQKLMNKFEQEDKKITPAAIRNLVTGKDIGTDFFEFCKAHIPVKYCEERQKGTRNCYLSDVSKLKKFCPALNFYDINYDFLAKYKAYMVTDLANEPNTIWKTFKFMKTMIYDAIRAKKFSGTNPFLEYKMDRYKQPSRKFLEIEDCRSIFKTLQDDISPTLRTVGYYYLFMCYTGLRFRDALYNFDANIHIINDERICMKTEKKDVEISLYINDLMRPVVDYVTKNKLSMSNQEYNRYLKVLGNLAKLKVTLTAHVGRHTFGGLLAKMDIPIKVAQKLLGHRDLKSTEIYFHMREKSMDKAMKGFDQL